MNLKAIEKSRKLLLQVMGQDNYDAFIENGKIEVKHNDTTYELDHDARVYNRTKNQFYCIEPICPDNLPIHDQLAIKYSYLLNKIERVEEVANKRYLSGYEQQTIPGNREVNHELRTRFAGTHDINYSAYVENLQSLGWRREPRTINQHPEQPGYHQYIEYLESLGWRRNQLCIDEQNTRIVTLSDSTPSEYLTEVVNIRCPAGQKMSIAGRNQSMENAHILRARFADEEDNEIPFNTVIVIEKETPSRDIVRIARPFYGDINLIRDTETQNGNQPLYKTYEQMYRFRQGIELNAEQRLIIYVFNCERNISIRNSRFSLECDMWVPS